MSDVSSEGFDAFRASERGEKRTGTVDARELSRVEDRLAYDDDAPGAAESPSLVTWTITGGKSAEGRPALKLELAGTLPLICQRCLQLLEWPLVHASEILLARTDAEMAALDDASAQEVLLAAAPVEPVTLVEDELVLTIPFVARHEGSCPPPADS